MLGEDVRIHMAREVIRLLRVGTLEGMFESRQRRRLRLPDVASPAEIDGKDSGQLLFATTCGRELAKPE